MMYCARGTVSTAVLWFTVFNVQRPVVQPVSGFQQEVNSHSWRWNTLSTLTPKALPFRPTLQIDHRYVVAAPYSIVLKAAADEESSDTPQDDESSSDMSSLSKEQKSHQLSNAYKLGQYAFASVAALVLLLPDRTQTLLLAHKYGGAAGFGIAAGLCHILHGANEHDRLGSDTYKRLNLGLLGFCGLGLCSIPGEAGFLSSTTGIATVATILTTGRLLGTALGFVGWKRGVKNGVVSSKGMINEIFGGVKDTMKGLKVRNDKKALAYRNCLALVGMGMVSSFMEGLFNIRYQQDFTRSLFQISLHWSAVARLFMITNIIYSLKDAAERDRLAGTTFIQLNMIVGLWALLVGLGQAIHPLGFAPYRGVAMYTFSVIFFLKALKSQKEKATKRKGIKE